jgi:hypothetical protein
MDLDIGSYRLQLPEGAVLPDPLEPPRPFRSSPLARIGPFELNAHLLDGTLQEWRETVSQATKNRAQFSDINVNGIPGVKLPGTAQRLDYAFQAPGEKRLEVVAWSDRATSSDEQRLIEDAIQTLQVRPRPSLILPETRR